MVYYCIIVYALPVRLVIWSVALYYVDYVDTYMCNTFVFFVFTGKIIITIAMNIFVIILAFIFVGW